MLVSKYTLQVSTEMEQTADEWQASHVSGWPKVFCQYQKAPWQQEHSTVNAPWSPYKMNKLVGYKAICRVGKQTATLSCLSDHKSELDIAEVFPIW